MRHKIHFMFILLSGSVALLGCGDGVGIPAGAGGAGGNGASAGTGGTSGSQSMRQARYTMRCVNVVGDSIVPITLDVLSTAEFVRDSSSRGTLSHQFDLTVLPRNLVEPMPIDFVVVVVDFILLDLGITGATPTTVAMRDDSPVFMYAAPDGTPHYSSEVATASLRLEPDVDEVALDVSGLALQLSVVSETTDEVLFAHDMPHCSTDDQAIPLGLAEGKSAITFPIQ